MDCGRNHHLDAYFGGRTQRALPIKQLHFHILPPEKDDKEEAEGKHGQADGNEAFQPVESISTDAQLILLLRVQLNWLRSAGSHHL